jgi:hypothetical protein
MSASKKNGIIVAAALSILFLAACDNSFDLLGKATDDVFVANNRYLKVVSTVPAPNSHGVFPQDPLRIIFDRAVSSPESLSGRVLITVGGTAVDTSAWTFSYDTGTFTLSIMPSGALLSECSVTVSIPLGITGQDGSRLREAYTWSYFTNNGVIVDPLAPPAPEGMDLSADDDMGPSNSDNITNKTQGLTVFGTASVSTPVRVMEGQSLLAATASDAAGRWSVELSLAEGAHSLSAIAVREETHASTASTPFILTVDTTVPAAASAPDLFAADDTGDSNTDNLTCLTSGITVTGTGEAGSLVTIMSGSTVAGSATVAAGGTYSADLSLGNGTYALTSVASDLAGNTVGSMGVLAITVDITPPSIPLPPDLNNLDDTGDSPTDNITQKNTGLRIISTDAGLKGRPISLKEGSTVLGTCIADSGTGAWEVLLTIPDGTHTIKAYAYSVSGVESTGSSAIQIVVDTTPPAKPVIPDLAADDDLGSFNLDNVTNKSVGLTISGNVEPYSTVHLQEQTGVTWNDIPITTPSNGKTASDGFWSIDLSRTAGSYPLKVFAVDTAGNQSLDSDVMTLIVDTSAPNYKPQSSNLVLASMDDSGMHNNDRNTNHTTELTLSGIAKNIDNSIEPYARVQLFEWDSPGTIIITVDADANGVWTCDLDLDSGIPPAYDGIKHYITGVTTDLAGNIDTSLKVNKDTSCIITVDTVPPNPPVWASWTPPTTSSTYDFYWYTTGCSRYVLTKLDDASGNWIVKDYKPINLTDPSPGTPLFHHIDEYGQWKMSLWNFDAAGNESSELTATTTFQ